MKKLQAIIKHKWRYLAIVGGFLLFVSPFAYFIKAAYFLQGSTADATLHKTCFRMSIDWLASGRFSSFDGRPLLIFFTGAVLVSAFFFGPLFCGWLCPVGSSTEILSRQMPRKAKLDLSGKINPIALRYGFFASFLAISALAVFVPESGLVSICCRFCASSQLQNLVSGIFDPSGLAFWHSGAVMALGGWFFIGGVFWKGGRGWCLYGCPLGALANVMHFVGAKIPFTYKLKHDPSHCTKCKKCQDVCPTWAIQMDSKNANINRHTCNACLERFCQ